MQLGLMQSISQAVFELRYEDVQRLVTEALLEELNPNDIVGALSNGMERVGDLFEKGEYALSDLIMGGEIMKRSLDVLRPHLTASVESGQLPHRGKIVIGTIEGDLHDIGKNIVINLLTSTGIEVFDLGTDVLPVTFAIKADEFGANVVGISSLLTTGVRRAGEVIQALEKEGIRDKVKVIMGGAAVRKTDTEKYGVDAAVDSAVEGVKIIKAWVEKNEA